MNSSKVQLAAISGLRYSLGIFLTTLMMVPIVSIVRRVFDETWNVNWQMMLSVSGVVTAFFFLFFFFTQLLEFRAASRRNQSNQLISPGAVWLRGIYLLVTFMGATIMVGTYTEGDPWWNVVLPFGFILLGYFAWPRAIRVNGNEIRQGRPLLGPRIISFGDIQTLVSDPTSGEAVVFGKNGQRILHSPMHVDADRFVRKIESLTGNETAVPGTKI